MRLTLVNLRGEADGWVDWNPDSGTLCGPLAQRLADRIEGARAAGFAVTHPYPGAVPVSDPLHSRREMAAVIGEVWQVPAELAGDYPHTPDPDDAGLPGIVF